MVDTSGWQANPTHWDDEPARAAVGVEQSLREMGAGRVQPEHVFLVTMMGPGVFGYTVTAVARTKETGQELADKRLAQFRHGTVSEWRVGAYGLWGPCEWLRDIDWQEPGVGWQAVEIQYLDTAP